MTPFEVLAVACFVGAVAVGIFALTGDLAERRAIVNAPDSLEDHLTCTGLDGTCGATICCCRRGRCTHTTELACPHGLDLCHVHRFECGACRVERAEDMWVDGWRDRLLGWL